MAITLATVVYACDRGAGFDLFTMRVGPRGVVEETNDRPVDTPFAGFGSQNPLVGGSADESAPAWIQSLTVDPAHFRLAFESDRDEDVVGAQNGAQSRADLCEYRIAGVVPQRIVELLEPVEVDDQQRQRLAALMRMRETRLQPATELAAVGQLGELVRRRLVAHLVKAADLAHRER